MYSLLAPILQVNRKKSTFFNLFIHFIDVGFRNLEVVKWCFIYHMLKRILKSYKGKISYENKLHNLCSKNALHISFFYYDFHHILMSSIRYP